MAQDIRKDLIRTEKKLTIQMQDFNKKEDQLNTDKLTLINLIHEMEYQIKSSGLFF